MTDNIESIGEGAFISCSNLTNVRIPNKVKRIEAYAFENAGLTSIVIPDSVTHIDDNTFIECTNLREVTILGNSITEIGEYAFSYCSNLSTIKLYANNHESIDIGTRAFGGNGEFETDGLYNYIAENSVIYVLSEEMKTELENGGKYNPDRTTVQVVTLDEMNEI